MLLIAVKLIAKPGQIDGLLNFLSQTAAHARKEAGVLVYDFYKSTENVDTLFMHEVYRDQAALDEHRFKMQPFHDQLIALLNESPEVSVWVPLPSNEE